MRHRYRNLETYSRLFARFKQRFDPMFAELPALLADRPIRWLVDDALKFVKREVRRGNRYHGIIFDPPSFGRGPKGEVFKIENDIVPLLDACRQLLAKDALFLLYICHTPGFTPLTLQNQLDELIHRRAGAFESGEMLVHDRAGRPLPPAGDGRCAVPLHRISSAANRESCRACG